MSARALLSGVRILDFTQVLAGPYASYQLALLGADVIKIERRGGEDMRRTPLSREWADRNMAPSFIAVNGNKRSLTLDLQKPAAREIVLKLAAKADVVMENFRAGVMDRLGLGYRGAVGDQSEADLLRDLRLRPDRSGEQRGRLRRQDPGDVRHHGDHRPSGDGPDPRRLRGVRRAVGRDRGVRDLLGAVPADPYRQGPVHRRLDAGGKPGVPDHAGRRLHRRGPSPAAGRQPGDQPQGDRQPVPRQGQFPAPGGQRRKAVPRA